MKPIGPIRYITIHASYTPPSMDIGAKTIHDWHVNERGWRDIGYHWVIRRNGTLEQGRDPSLQGAHVGGHNAGNLGICLIGGKGERADVPEDNFTDAQWIRLFNLVREWHLKYPDAIILGHNGFPGHEMRGCPCFDWRKWRLDFHRRLREKLPQLPSHWYSELDLEGP